jgi:hypothetical protein
MISTWRMLGLQTLLAGALAAGPAAAADSDGSEKPPDLATIAKQLAAIKKKVDTLDTLKEGLDSLKQASETAKQSFEKLEKDVRAELIDLRAKAIANELKTAKTQEDVADLRLQIEKLRKDLEVLSGRMATPRESAYPPREAPPPTGRLRLVNTFYQPMTIVLNRMAYTVPPNETRTVEGVPAGTFTYEVVGVQPARNLPLAANETFTVTVHPR